MMGIILSEILKDAAPGERVALAGSGRQPMSFAELVAQLEYIASWCEQEGLVAGSRVATVLPDGPEAATAVMGLSSYLSCAPLNPAYKAPELRFYLGDMKASAVVVLEGHDGPAVSVAEELGLGLIRLIPQTDRPAGSLTFKATSPLTADSLDPEVGLLLHTSGTTARPKLAPLKRERLYESARNVARTLKLSAEDRGLCVMPLFHIHGLVAGLLAPLLAGSAVFCSPGFQRPRFFEWVREWEPTWYTSSPTIHHDAVSEAEKVCPNGSPLRFVRSCSATLPAEVRQRMLAQFQGDVLEAYGMTEAAHQICTGTVSEHRPGSVGKQDRVEVKIEGQDSAGGVGEVLLRGPTIFDGYEANPDANEAAFYEDWFRTGDLGYLDEDGYLFLVGRIKEQINRGGEKISPLEVEALLLEVPGVSQAVVFAVAHPRLGEEVGAAVIATDDRFGRRVSETGLRHHLSSRLAFFKIPSTIAVVSKFPKGPTGKLQRTNMAEQLGIRSSTLSTSTEEYEAPEEGTEEQLAALWKELLGLAVVGRRDHFFEIGGDSVLAALLCDRIGSEFGRQVNLIQLFESPRLYQLARLLSRPERAVSQHLARLQPRGTRTPLFLVHPYEGEAGGFHRLCLHLGTDQPVYGLVAKGRDLTEPPHRSIPEMVEAYLKELREVQPHGPYLLAGRCLGSIVALEMAHRLLDEGEDVPLLVILDTMTVPRLWPGRQGQGQRSSDLKGYWRDFLWRLKQFLASPYDYFWFRYLWLKGKILGLRDPAARIISIHNSARRKHFTRKYPKDVLLFCHAKDIEYHPSMRGYVEKWEALVEGKLEKVELDCSHFSMLTEPHVAVLAEALSERF
jgi:acyl-CoA synthetase (AMP-forming)/AMP-acid ligase II/thioesterase domain-containing protein